MPSMNNKKHKCPPHHWILDENNIGRCKYCPAVKDFGALLKNQTLFLKRLEKEVI